jgi:hypothetical protein
MLIVRRNMTSAAKFLSTSRDKVASPAATPERDEDLERLRALARSSDDAASGVSLRGLTREQRRRTMLGL